MRILVAVPVYNEEKYVVQVLGEIRRYAQHVLVVDDGSTDQTPCLLPKLPVDVIRHATNLGYGRSIRDAFRWAQCYDYDWLITMDCDEQHEPRSLPDFYRAIEADDADIISGSRYLDPQICGDPPPPDRQAINQQITELLNQRLGLSLTDAFCGFKAYRVSSLRHLDLTVSGYAMPIQLWVQAAAHGLRIKEIPVRLIYKDPTRSFGGTLDDPALRLAHYKEVFNQELAKFPDKFPEKFDQPCSCACR
ncbi:MAG TPA: glycosyltransferase family 2 protein [Phycisphaeraceae bacterium]